MFKYQANLLKSLDYRHEDADTSCEIKKKKKKTGVKGQFDPSHQSNLTFFWRIKKSNGSESFPDKNSSGILPRRVPRGGGVRCGQVNINKFHLYFFFHFKLLSTSRLVLPTYKDWLDVSVANGILRKFTWIPFMDLYRIPWCKNLMRKTGWIRNSHKPPTPIAPQISWPRKFLVSRNMILARANVPKGFSIPQQQQMHIT